MDKPKKWYLVYYRIDGKPRGETKARFIFSAILMFLLPIICFLIFPPIVGLTVIIFWIPLWLAMWGIGRSNAKKLERGENRR